jgi:hypothetical protein
MVRNVNGGGWGKACRSKGELPQGTVINTQDSGIHCFESSERSERNGAEALCAVRQFFCPLGGVFRGLVMLSAFT